MTTYSFDQISDLAATHTSALNGQELIALCNHLLIRYDDIRRRKHIACFLHMLLHDLGYYNESDTSAWTEMELFAYLNKYEL